MIRSSAGQLEEFKKTIIWLDVLDELESWLSDIHSMLENHEVKLSHRELDRLGGNAEAFHRFEHILDYMINSIEIEQEDMKAKREEEQLKRETENGR